MSTTALRARYIGSGEDVLVRWPDPNHALVAPLWPFRRPALGLRFQVNTVSDLHTMCRCLELAAFNSRFSAMSYDQDIFGRKVLLGLTYAETCEFELLEAAPPVDEQWAHLEMGNRRSVVSSQSCPVAGIV